MGISSVSFPFPSDLDHPKKKETKEWGLQAAKAIWSNNDTYGPSLFYNERETYESYLRYFRGEQDINQYKPAVGINPQEAKETFVGGIRWQIKNYATKRVNIAVSKVINRKYDPIATAIDPIAIDRRMDYESNLKVFMKEKEWLAQVMEMTGQDLMPEGMSFEELPINNEDLKIHMETDHKYEDEMDLELGITHHSDRNDLDQIKSNWAFDLFVLGVGGVYVGMDSNMMPVIEWRDPSRIIAPRTETEDYKRSKYVGYYDEYTVSEFRKLHGGEFDKDEERRIVEEHAKKGDQYMYSDSYHSYDDVTERDVDKIAIMHFEIESTSEHVYLEKPDKMGNMRFHEKDYDYYKTPEQQKKFKDRYKGERKLHRKQYKCIYEGYYIIGSDYIFGYKKKENNTGRLGYKLFAPNLRDNKNVSTLKQMIPCLDNLETYDKKIQQIVASAVPKGVYIDLMALREASFEMGGKMMKEEDLLRMYFQKGIVIGHSGDAYGNGNGYKPITELENGMSNDVINYINLINKELQDLDEIIGINKVTAASNLHQDTGKAVAQQMQLNTEVALDYLYRADKKLMMSVYEELADLHLQSVKYDETGVYIPIFGKSSVERMKEAFSRHKYGIEIEARPTEQEWAEFYMDLKKYVDQGRIDPEDEIQVRRANNLKQAQAYLKVVMRKKKKEAQEAKMMDIQANSQAQMQSNNQAHQNNLQLKQVESQSNISEILEERKTKALEHKWKMEQITLELDAKRRNSLIEIEAKGDEELEQIVTKERYSKKE